MTVQYVEIGSIFQMSSGGTPSKKNPEYYLNGDIPWVKTGDLKTMYLDNVDDYITKLGVEKSSAKVFPKGTVLIAMYGATIGNCSILNFEAATNQACAAFLPNEKVLPEFLYFYLTSIKEKLVSLGVGGAQPNISQSILKSIKFPLMTLEKQIKVIEVLSEGTTLIKKRQCQITALDELTQSLFLEMFGDPIANTRNWDLVELAEVAEIKIGPFGTLLHKEDYTLGGHPLVNPSHIVEGKVKYDINLTISDEKYMELSPYNLKIGDLVLGRRGEMGRCAVVKEEGLLCGTGSMIIRSKGNIHPEIMQKIISFPSYKKTIEDKAVGQTMPNLNVQIVSKLLIPMIPESVQMDYFEMLNKIEKNKELFKRSLKSMQDLYNSLLQKAFKGELYQD